MPQPSSPPCAYSAPELAEAVNRWCEDHGVHPMTEQTAPLLTERNIHYYRSLGLVTAPTRGRGPGYGEKQFLQLVAIRLLQARGLPQRRIRDLLYGRSVKALRQIRDKGLAEPLPRSEPSNFEFPSPESWNMIPVSDEFLLVNRSGRPIDPETLRSVRDLLAGRTHPNRHQ